VRWRDRAPRSRSSSRALIAVPSLDEPREFVRSRRRVSLPNSAVCASFRKPA
jgi:hypothetical protein